MGLVDPFGDGPVLFDEAEVVCGDPNRLFGGCALVLLELLIKNGLLFPTAPNGFTKGPDELNTRPPTSPPPARVNISGIIFPHLQAGSGEVSVA